MMRTTRTALLGAVVLVSACGHSSSKTGALPLSGQSPQTTLSGVILAGRPGGLPVGLPNVLVTFDPGGAAERRARTDAAGRFVVQDLPPGLFEVEIDGSAANAPAERYPVQKVRVAIAPGAANRLPYAVTLPDLERPEVAIDSVPIEPAQPGVTQRRFDARGADPRVRARSPKATTIQIDGTPATGFVDVELARADSAQAPVPWPPPGQSLDAASFVFVSPPDASFDRDPSTPALEGIDTLVPDRRGFGIGKTLEVWQFEEATGTWVQTGTATSDFDQIEYPRAPLGGWHVAADTVDSGCATTLEGTVLSAGGQPVAGARVRTSLGHQTTTGADGSFSIPALPAYDPTQLPACAPVAVRVDVLTSAADGAGVSRFDVLPFQVQPGGVTQMGGLAVPVAKTGIVSGRVTDNGTGLASQVSISGPATAQVKSEADGSFFRAGLPPGTYVARTTFPGDSKPTAVSFQVTQRGTTTIDLQRTQGSGTGSLRVLALVDDDGRIETPLVPAAGARVTVVGLDTVSQSGLARIANLAGQADFAQVDGPFTVTVQLDSGAQRLASTVAGVTPAAGVVAVPLLNATPDLVPTVTMSGQVQSSPALGPGQSLRVRVQERDGPFETEVPVSGTSYTAFVPPDAVLDAALFVAEPAGNAQRPVSVWLSPGLTADPLAGLVHDFDASLPAVAFSTNVPVTWSNLLPFANDNRIDLALIDPSGPRFDFALFRGPQPLPASVDLPDPSAAPIAGWSLSFSAGQSDGLRETSCTLQRSDATLPPVTFATPPVVTQPADGASIPLGQVESLDVAWSPAVPSLAPAVDLVTIDTAGAPAGPLAPTWTLYVRPGVNSVSLPPAAQPMFSSGQAHTLEVLAVGSSQAIDFDAFFGAGLDDGLRDLLQTGERCEASQRIGFSVP